MYENEATLSEERKIADYLSRSSGAEIIKLPMQYKIDFVALKRGKVASFVEIKRRGIEMAKYPTIILSLAKFLAGRELAGYACSKFHFCIGTNDGIYLADLTDRDFAVSWGGRTDRQDWQDSEPVIHIPGNVFRRC